MKRIILPVLILLFWVSIASATNTISGTVSGVTADGVTMTLTGDATASTTTAGGGLYSFAGLNNGNYVVTPSKTNYLFNPFFVAIVVASADVTTVNFISAASSTAGLTPAIQVLPGSTVEVGQEVYFSASGSTIPSDATLGCTTGNNCGAKAEYRWNFGDGYACQKGCGLTGQPNYSIDCKSLALTHFFMVPGTYTVMLNVFIYDDWQIATGIGQGTPLSTGTVSTTITVTGTAPVAGFEIQRANLNNRTKQYLYIQIPAGNRTSSYDLKLSLIDSTASSTATLLTKNNPGAEEIYLLDHIGLTVGHSYVLQAQILNHGDSSQISGGIWRDLFVHTVATPATLIDENNSFIRGGSLFFPVGPYMYGSLNAGWTSMLNTYINMQHTQDWAATYTPTTWGDYVDIGAANNLVEIGPARGDYGIDFSPAGANYWEVNHNVDEIAAYVTANKDKTAMFAWGWQDEPSLGGNGSSPYLNTMGAWGYVAHSNDANHPSFDMMAGYDYSPYYGTSPRKYDYLGGEWYMGGKKWIQDIFGFDIYPYSYRLHATMNRATAGPISTYLEAMDIMQSVNKGLIPIIPTIQPCSEIAGESSLRTPTDAQNYSLSWLSVIHGAKGVIWFPMFDASTIRWTSMGKFTDQVTVLKDVILGTPSTKTVTRTDQANAALNRVDTMVRESGGVVYVFAGRVTEPDPITGVIDSPYPTITAGGHAGTNYQVNDVLVLAGGNSGSIYVNGVDGGGAITSFYLNTRGDGYSISTGNAVSGGHGTGAQFDINAVQNALYTGTEGATVVPTFTVSGLTGTVSTPVYGESRSVDVVDGVFTDTFAKNDVHIYQIGGSAGAAPVSMSGCTISGGSVH